MIWPTPREKASIHVTEDAREDARVDSTYYRMSLERPVQNAYKL